MNQKEWIELMGAPQNANLNDVVNLAQLKNEFPYFQSAHLLLSLTSKKYNSSLYQQNLKNAAISIPNRSRLFFLLNDVEKPSQIVGRKGEVKKSMEVFELPLKENASEIQHLQNIESLSEKRNNELEEEKLNEQINKEVEKQVVSALVEKELESISILKANENKKKPLVKGSFTQWLKEFEPTNEMNLKVDFTEQIKPQSEVKFNPNKKAEQKVLIDKIIENNPGNIRLSTDQKFFTADNQAKQSLLENEDLVTETLAKIYGLQGQTSKAIRAYEILSLKFPQKSAYFAALIEKLKI